MNEQCEVTVIGTGAMGSAIGNQLLANGYRVAVWNRTARRTRALVENGAIGFGDLTAAITASPVAVMCIQDYAIGNLLINSVASTQVLNNRTLVQLSTGTPEQAKAQSQDIHSLRGHFIAGGILASPASIGSMEAMVLYAGDPIYEKYEKMLMSLGGQSRYLGVQPDKAVGTYLSLGSFLSIAQCAFYETAALALQFGVDIATFHSLAKVSLMELKEELARATKRIGENSYVDSVATVDIYYQALAAVIPSLASTGVPLRMVGGAIAHLEQASADGHGNHDIATLVQVLTPQST